MKKLDTVAVIAFHAFVLMVIVAIANQVEDYMTTYAVLGELPVDFAIRWMRGIVAALPAVVQYGFGYRIALAALGYNKAAPWEYGVWTMAFFVDNIADIVFRTIWPTTELTWGTWPWNSFLWSTFITFTVYGFFSEFALTWGVSQIVNLWPNVKPLYAGLFPQNSRKQGALQKFLTWLLGGRADKNDDDAGDDNPKPRGPGRPPKNPQPQGQPQAPQQPSDKQGNLW